MENTPETRVLYNDTCPLCRFEIGHYRRGAARKALPIRFDDLGAAAEFGLTPDQAARRLHVAVGGEVLSGLAAFRALWAAMPGWRWVAWVTGLPVIRPVLALVYDRIAAPLLYRAHLRRQTRQRP